MKQFFITGTDTHVGKTLVSAILTLALQARYWKPIQSGIADEMADQDKVRALTGLPKTCFFPSTYALQASLSPDQAARLENIDIDLAQCILPNVSGSLIVEGAGGVHVPLNAHACMVNLMKQCALPVVIVARGTLGTINHTLLTIEALRARQLTIAGVIFSGELNFQNQQAIEKWGQVRTLLHIPKFTNVTPKVVQEWVRNNQYKIIEVFNDAVNA